MTEQKTICTTCLRLRQGYCDGEWKNWNPKKIWVPSKEGLGMKAVFDMVNEIYGKDFYRYE